MCACVHVHVHVHVCMYACACHVRVASQLTHSPLPDLQRCNVHSRTQPHTLQPNRPNDRTRPSAQVLRLSELPFYDLAGLLTPLIASSLGAPAASVRSFLHLNERAACRTRQLGAAATPRPLDCPVVVRGWPWVALHTRQERLRRTATPRERKVPLRPRQGRASEPASFQHAGDS